MKTKISHDPDDYSLTFETLEKLCVDDETIDIIRHQISNWDGLASGDNIERHTIPFMPAAFLKPNIESRSVQIAYFERDCESKNHEEAARKLESHAVMLASFVDYRRLENQILKMRCNAGEHELKAVIDGRDQESRVMYEAGLDFRRKAWDLRAIRTPGPASD